MSVMILLLHIQGYWFKLLDKIKYFKANKIRYFSIKVFRSVSNINGRTFYGVSRTRLLYFVQLSIRCIREPCDVSRCFLFDRIRTQNTNICIVATTYHYYIAFLYVPTPEYGDDIQGFLRPLQVMLFLTNCGNTKIFLEPLQRDQPYRWRGQPTAVPQMRLGRVRGTHIFRWVGLSDYE